MRRAASAAIIALLAVAGCGDDSTPTTTGDEPASADSKSQLSASCGEVEFDTIPADPSGFESADALWVEIDLSEVGMEAEFFDLYDWSIVTQTDQELVLFGSPLEPTADGPQYASASFDREAERWTPHSWGQCRIELTAPGFGPARFILDPDHQPDPAASTLAVLATEMACTSGEAPKGRDVKSVVVAQDDDSVSVVVLVEPPTGDQDCQGNPSFPLEVDLGSPLGDRTVFDGGVQPALERPWPPTESSLESTGLTE